MSILKTLIEKRGLWDNIHAKRKRIKAGSGEKMRKPGSKGAPTDADFKAANEETELDEAVTVKKDNYSWGKMVTVHHGSETSYPLHPEHQSAIKKLKDGEHTSFTDETKRKVTAKREGDKVHLSGAGSNKKTTVAHSHFNEEVEVKDTDDYKLSKSGKKMKAHKIVFNKGEEENKKGVSEQMKKSYKDFVEQHAPELTEEQENEIVAELLEVLGKDAKAGEWISDFVKSDNPKFAGKSKEKRKQMALAAYYAKQRNEGVEIDEELLDELSKGTLQSYMKKAKTNYGTQSKRISRAYMTGDDADAQHKREARKSGMAKARDKLSMAKEEVEQIDEATDYAKLAKKHMSVALSRKSTPAQADYARKMHKRALAASKMSDAEAAHKHYMGVKEEAEMDEELKGNQHKLDKNKNGKLDKHDFKLLRKEDAEQIDELSKDTLTSYAIKAGKSLGGQVANIGNAKQISKFHADKTSAKEVKKDAIHTAGKRMFGLGRAASRLAKEETEQVDESSPFDWKNTPRQTSDNSKTKTMHDVKKTSTGTEYTKQRDADGMSKEFKRDPEEAKRGRGRPKKNKFSEAAEFLIGLDEEMFDSFMEEGFDSFMDQFEQLDEISKATLGSYVKKASRNAVVQRKIAADFEQQADKSRKPGMKAAATSLADKYKAKSWSRSHNINKAVDRLTK